LYNSLNFLMTRASEQLSADPVFDRETLLKRATVGALALGLGPLLSGCGNKKSDTEVVRGSGEFAQTPSWEHDFSSMPEGPINPTVWNFELNPEVPGYNNEQQGYTDSVKNVRIEDGLLIIEAHKEPYQYPNDPESRAFRYTSGRIDTRSSLAFEHGKVKVNMRLPEGAGVWPAFWFLSANNPYTSKLHPTDEDWQKPRFYLKDGELDGLEYYGDNPGMIEATVHTFVESFSKQVPLTDATEKFHTYGVELTPQKIVWTLDSKPYYSVKKPSDNPDEWAFGNGNKLYMILNLAMGGTASGEIDDSKAPWRMEVGNIRFYEYTGE